MKLSRHRRMRQWGEFQAVRRAGRSAGGKYLVLGTLADSALGAERKFGFITSKKAAKRANKRNLMRRHFREIVRTHGDDLLPGHYFVTIARWRAAEATHAELEQDWLKVARRLKLLVIKETEA